MAAVQVSLHPVLPIDPRMPGLDIKPDLVATVPEVFLQRLGDLCLLVVAADEGSPPRNGARQVVLALVVAGGAYRSFSAAVVDA